MQSKETGRTIILDQVDRRRHEAGPTADNMLYSGAGPKRVKKLKKYYCASLVFISNYGNLLVRSADYVQLRF
jgi:hypothetical protein